MSAAKRALMIALGFALLGACSKDEGTAAGGAGGGSAAEGAAEPDPLVERWKEGGLEISPLTPAKVGFGKDCQQGTASGVDVLLCRYASPAEARAAEEAGLAWVGATTGLSVARGDVLLVAADRQKRDPSGRTLNQLAKLAAK